MSHLNLIMAHFKWRDNHMEKFLELYEAEECLWNSKCESYKDKMQRARSYERLRQGMGIDGLSVYDVKNKIKSVRTGYKSELNKLLRSGTGNDDEMYTPQLFWFAQADAFLRSVSVGKESPLTTISNLSMNQSIHINNINDYEDDDDETQVASGLYQKIPLQTIITTKEDSQETPIVLDTPSSSQMKSRIKRKIADSSFEERVNKLQALTEESKDNSDDEFEFFCKSLACQLRKMPLDRALICQEKLQSVMTQERLHQIGIVYEQSVLNNTSGNNINWNNHHQQQSSPYPHSSFSSSLKRETANTYHT